MGEEKESNVHGVAQVDGDVLLPPRKRLLAGFKKQSSDADVSPDVASTSHRPVIASSPSFASPSTPSASSPPLHPTSVSPSLIPCSPSSSEFFQARLDDLLSSYLTNDHNISPEKIVEASKTVAETAASAAKTARDAAQEKANIAARAVAAAKSALALVASYPEEEAGSRDGVLKDNKLKKHAQVQVPSANFRDDEELARKLHKVINKYPRISKGIPSLESKGHNSKKHKNSPCSDGTRNSKGSKLIGKTSHSNGKAVAGVFGYEESLQKEYTGTATKKFNKAIQMETKGEEPESGNPREKRMGFADSPSKKAGKLKLKKLPLSICSSKDSAISKDYSLPGSCSTDEPFPPKKHCDDSALTPIDTPTTWKCQEFKAPERVNQNEVMQS